MYKIPSAKRTAITSSLVSLLDIILNLGIAIISGSVTMLAQAIQGFSDFTSGGLVTWGVFRSGAPTSAKHPFGSGKETYFWTLIAAFIMIAVTAVLSIYFGWRNFINPGVIEYFHFAILVLVITLSTNLYSLSNSAKRILGKNQISKVWSEFKDTPLIESKTTFIIDLMGASASFLGLISLLLYYLLDDLRFDGIGAMSIGGVLAMLSILLIFSIKDFIVGKSLPLKLNKKIERLALSVDGVGSVLDLKTMYIGPDRYLVNIEIHIKDGRNTNEVERIIDDVKSAIRKSIPKVTHIQVEPETP